MPAALPAWMQGSPSFMADAPPAEMPAAFAFRVGFSRSGSSASPVLTSFQEVSGLEHNLETEDVVDGGENRFVLQLPKPARARRLQLKRGLVDRGSPFVRWCKDCLEPGLSIPLVLQDVQVQLMDAELNPLMVWTCNRAYPVRWTINGFESQRNEVAIEEIELAYQTLVSPS